MLIMTCGIGLTGYVNYRFNYGGNFGGSTAFTLGGTYASGGKISYTYNQDINADGQNQNDLIYVPKKRVGTDI